METLSGEALENKQFNHRQRLYDDTTTWLAEALNGNLRTSFEFSFDGNELYSQDGGKIRTVFEQSLEDSINLPANLSFEWRRRNHEFEEYQEMVSMMRGNNFNTIVVVSDFPAELNKQSRDIGGYNVTRKQTMLRVITKTEENKLQLTTQSLDGSNRQALEEIYNYFGLCPEQGELLEQRIHANLSSIEQNNLADDLTKIYDHELTKQYGGNFYAGQRESNFIDTYSFIRTQSDLVDHYLHNVQSFGENPDILLGVIAAIEVRFDKLTVDNITKHDFVQTPDCLMIEINNAIAQTYTEQRQYSGCGLSLSSQETVITELSQSGYGNKTNIEQKYSFNKKMHCVVCQSPPKAPNEPKKMCGPCGICKSCDKALSSKIK